MIEVRGFEKKCVMYTYYHILELQLDALDMDSHTLKARIRV